MKKVIILLLSISIMSCNMGGSGNNNNNNDKDPFEVGTQYVVDGLGNYVEYGDLPRLRGFDATVMDGYNSIEELAADLDRVAMEVGLQYIENIETYYWYGAVDDLAVDAPMEESNDGDTNDSGGYDTNVQVSGVDEADMVKSDGEYIYTIYGTELIISDLSGNITDRDSLFDGDYIDGMVLVKETNTLIAYISQYWGDGNDLVICDISSGEVVSKSVETIPGIISDIRVTGSDVLIFSDRDFDYWVLFEDLFDYEDYYGEEYYGEDSVTSDAEEPAAEPAQDTADSVDEDKVGSRSLDKAEARERLKSTIPNWRNKIILDHFMEGDSVNTNLLNKTQKIYDTVGVDDDEYVNKLTSIKRLTTFSTSSGINSKSEALIFSSGWGSYVYTNGFVSVIAAQGWTFDNDRWSERTYLSAFYTENSDTYPLSAGVLPGVLNNQFSMDFYDNYFRIGLTQGDWWAPTSNDLYVVDFSSPAMEVIGEITGLGKPNERIMSMRFMGEKAYMVTFEQTDPFYTLDLSDPANPVKAGELEIPGFSAYLHPINDDTLLAVGPSGDDFGLDGGFQIVFYDVSDFDNPVQSLPYVLPNTWSSSTWDHHAFRYFNGVLVLPMFVYDYNGYFSGFKVFDINEETFEISERSGEISHLSNNENYYDDYYYYLSPRSMIFTGSNQLITFKEGKIISSVLDSDTLETNWTLPLD